MKRLLLSIRTLGVLLALPIAAVACMCSYMDSPDAFESAKVVFVGKVTKIVRTKEASIGLLMKESGTLELLKKPRWEKSTYGAQIVTLEIREAFKGTTNQTIDVVTAVYDHGATCGVNFTVGENYLVYAYDRRRELSTEQVKVPRNEWTKEIKLKSDADKFNARLPDFDTSICARTERIRFAADDVDIIRRVLKGEAVPRAPRPAHPIIW